MAGEVTEFLDKLGLGWDYDIHDLCLRLAELPAPPCALFSAEYIPLKVGHLNKGDSLTITYWV